MIGQSAGKDFAYILGVYLGDGCVTGTGRHSDRIAFRLNTIDEDFALAVKAALEALSEYSVTVGSHSVAKSKNPNWYVSFSDPLICNVLRSDTQGKQVIPAYVWGWSDEGLRAFIAGLMDSEGFVAAKTGGTTGRSFYMGFKSCDVWVPDFIRILQKVGVKIGKVSQEAPRKPGYKTPMRFAIKMQSWVGAGCYFNIRRKQDRIDRWAATEPYTERSRYPRRSTSETTRRTAA